MSSKGVRMLICKDGLDPKIIPQVKNVTPIQDPRYTKEPVMEAPMEWIRSWVIVLQRGE